MIVVVSCSIIAWFLTLLDSKGILSGGMRMAFLILATLGVIHYDYGNDYTNYYEIYHSITDSVNSWHDIFGGLVYKDVGWTLLCIFFSHIGGFFVLIGAINIFENFIYYKMIKCFLPRNQWHFAIFIYLFNYCYYLLSFSMLRQSLAIALLVLTIIIIYRKRRYRYMVSAIIFLFACSVHSSALFFALAYMLWLLPLKNTKILSYIVLFLFALIVTFRGVMANIMQPFLSIATFNNFAENYSGEYVSGLGILFFINSIPLFVATYLFYYNKFQDEAERHIVLYSVIGLIIVPFSTIILMISRLSFYFSVFSIVVYPIIYHKMTHPVMKFGFISLLVMSLLYSYYDFFTSETYMQPYAVFHTIFEVL